MMIKELKNVIEVVDDLKASNLVNVQILKKALTDINGRLEEISDGDELMFIRNSIAQFKEALDFKFSNIMERIKELKVSAGDDSAAVENATLLEDKFKSVSSIFDSGMKLLSTKLDDIENSFSRVAAANIETAKEEFAKLSKELKVNQQEIVETHKTFDENTIERFSFVAESIKMLSENLNVQTNLYKEFIDRKTSEIRDYVEANENGIKEDNALVRTELEDKFKEIEKANSGLAAELEQIKDSVNDVIAKSDKILQGTSQELGTELEKVSGAVHEILAGIDNLHSFSETVNQSVEKIIDFNEKHDYADILNTLSELEKFDIGFINEFTAIKTSLDNILSEMEKLPVNTSQAVALELKSVTEIAEDTLAEIKVLQNFSGNILRSVDKISELTENNQDKEAILQTIKALEGANTAFAGELEVIKDTVGEVLDKADTLVTSQNMAAGLKNVTDLTQETLAEVKTLQNFSGDILKSVDKLAVLAEGNDKETVLQVVKQLEEANIEFANDLDTIKASITEVLNKADSLPDATSQQVAGELKTVTDVARDALSEIKVLQDYSTNIIKSVNKIADYTDKNQNEDIFEAIKELDITQNIADLFEKVEIFNNNFNIKTEFLEEQIQQMKTMFSDIAIDMQNKEAELLQKESQKVQDYYSKIETVSDSMLILEESLKASGVEYQENIAALNKQLNDFIAEFNTIYNELSGTAQLEINNSLEELKQEDFKYDYYISGSDQLWNLQAKDFDWANYLEFVKKGKKISYAASFGPKKQTWNEEEKNRAKKDLKEYNFLSVREEGSFNNVVELTGRIPEINIDPTMLLDKKEWEKIIEKEAIIKEKYILLYDIHGKTETFKIAKKISRNLGIKVIIPKENVRAHLFYPFKKHYNNGPIEFLNLLNNAEIVLSSSFHGTVFSILLHKPFLAINGAKDFRISTLLKKMGLELISVAMHAPPPSA